ncbi:hypothetical protein [uncultured Comamonas sp.]|uniref:hypothetical protein n=1 Tax=uncultured Comamonas sp. TaxID=114710 RepID=UPI002600CEE7|nr:hypothetical protein [uncultured Comamonas sp.]
MAITVMVSMLADGGKRAMARKVSTAGDSYIRASGRMLPSAGGTPATIFHVMPLATLLMSIWPTVIPNVRSPSFMRDGIAFAVLPRRGRLSIGSA